MSFNENCTCPQRKTEIAGRPQFHPARVFWGEGKGGGGENSHMKETRILVVSFSVVKLQVLFSLQG